MSAYQELQDFLEEPIEAIVFGPWGWGSWPREGGQWEAGYGEPGIDDPFHRCDDDRPPVPFEKRGVVLSASEAKPFMQGWSFSGGYGAPDCYAIRAWSKNWVAWVTQYDGATRLDRAPRNPIDTKPDMPGG